MPIRAAVLNAEQYAEYKRTGKVPENARLTSFDDNGNALEKGMPNLADLQRVDGSGGAVLGQPPAGWKPPLSQPAFTAEDAKVAADTLHRALKMTPERFDKLANEALRLANNSVTPVDRAAIDGAAIRLIEAIGTLPLTGINNVVPLMVKALTEVFRLGFGCAAGQALFGDIKEMP